MDSWDTLFPFPADEINLFTRLHQKATKFPAPSGIKTRNHEQVEVIVSDNIDSPESDSNDQYMTTINSTLSSLKQQYEHSKRLLNDIDLILEAHKQLTLIEHLPQSQFTSSSPRSSLQVELEAVQGRIAYQQKLHNCLHFLSTVSIPSAASSPAFTASLRFLLSHQNGLLLSPQLLQRVSHFQQKCWDNAILAMERVLERDLISIEAYLDDSVYKEMRDKVLKELIDPLTINPQLFNALILHFLTAYTQLRENFVTFVLDTRLNTQFTSSPPRDQVLHLIERTRLLMVVETREFTEIFGKISEIPLQPHLNKILETVGNLLLQRIESPCKQLNNQDSTEISAFIHPLIDSILTENNQKDPFGLFLKLLTERFNFIKTSENIKIVITSEPSEIVNTHVNTSETVNNNTIISSYNQSNVINV